MKSSKLDDAMLKPTLGLWDATAISIGAIIGAGIFVVTGIGAGLAGSALAISMVIAAVIALFTALSFAELTAWQPKEGSIYEYAYSLISPLAGFLAGWMWILSNIFGGAAVSLGFAYYLKEIFPAIQPNITAAILCIAFTLLNFLGIRESAFVNNILVIAKIAVLTFFIIFGLTYINPANFTPFEPLKIEVLSAAFYIFFAYGGFARVAVIAEEVKNAKRNVPKAILFSLAISTALYILVGVVALGLVGKLGLEGSRSPLADAIGVTGNVAAIYLVSVGGLLATATVLLTSILGVSRIVYAMARREDLPQVLGNLHSKYKTPYFSVFMVGGIMTLLALFIDLSQVIAISTFALLFYYSLANVSALRLKIKKRVYPRFVPVLGFTSCLTLLIFTLFVSPQSWIAGVSGLFLGIICYFIKENLLKE